MAVNFWQDLDKPILALAPMYDVTDVVFRQIVAETARPDAFFTEFVNVDAFQSEGREHHLDKLKFAEEQRPIVAQIWGMNPENYEKTAKELVEMGFDGIDINMGCPQKSVVKIGACAALIDNPELAGEIIQATKRGAGKIPVSVKTRTGTKKHVTEKWIKFLLEQDIATLTLHGRTLKQMSKVPADWKEIQKAVKIRDELGLDTPIIGNGDVKNYKDAEERCEKYRTDGAMIGRGIFQDVFAFDKKGYSPTTQELIDLLIKHIELFVKTYKGKKNYNILKKFYKVYVRDFRSSSEVREKLMETTTPEDAVSLLQSLRL